MSNITVIVCEPGKKPEVRVIDNGLKAMQAIVGGYIELVRSYLPPYDIYCNEEGLIEDLPINLFGIRGTFFISKSDEEYESVSLDQFDIDAILMRL